MMVTRLSCNCSTFGQHLTQQIMSFWVNVVLYFWLYWNCSWLVWVLIVKSHAVGLGEWCSVRSIDLEVWSATGFGPWTHSVHHVHPTPGLCYPAVRYHLRPLYPPPPPPFCVCVCVVVFFCFFLLMVRSYMTWFSCTFRVSSLIRDMASSIEEFGVWVKENKLKTNVDKTELISIRSKSKLKSKSKHQLNGFPRLWDCIFWISTESS